MPSAVSPEGLATARALAGQLEAAVSEALGAPGRATVLLETSAARLLARLRSAGADAVVLDARAEPAALGASAGECTSALRALFTEHELGCVGTRERTFVVVPAHESGTALAFEAGKLRLAGVFATPAHDALAALPEALRAEVAATLARGTGGRVALCLAGGGIEGLFWELGAIRAIQHFLPDFDLSRVDIVCGISAGAVIASLLANGVSPPDISAGFDGRDPRVLPLRRQDLFDPNVLEFGKRAVSLGWDAVRGMRSPLSALFRVPPAGAFAGARLGKRLAAQFAKPGFTDDFAKLESKLFIGATDQDTNEHVVFGADGAPRASIHQAVRASTALAPFYAPEKIGGRFYVDGGFTRTTNMRVAVQHGATLVLLVDPLVPAASATPGAVAERGAVYVAMQGLKSLIHGRFDKAMPTLRAMYPHVAFHLFQPGERSRRVMSGSPMKVFYRREIEEIAYRETLREIRVRRATGLGRDFARHSIEFKDPDAWRGSAKSPRVHISAVT